MGSAERMRAWRQRQDPDKRRQKDRDYKMLYRRRKRLNAFKLQRTQQPPPPPTERTKPSSAVTRLGRNKSDPVQPEGRSKSDIVMGPVKTEETPSDRTEGMAEGVEGLADDDVYGSRMVKGEVKAKHLIFKHPFTALVAGLTGSGKTYFVTKMIENAKEMIDPPPEEIYWFYGTQMDELPGLQEKYGVKVSSGLLNMTKLEETWRSKGPLIPRLMILDDLMMDTKDNVISTLFSRGSHHLNLSVIFIVQNIFHQNREMRNIFLNAQYKILFQNPGDATQLTIINNRMYPGSRSFLQRVLEDVAGRVVHAYLVLDTHPRTPMDLRVRTKIFPGETNSVYVPR